MKVAGDRTATEIAKKKRQIIRPDSVDWILLAKRGMEKNKGLEGNVTRRN
jgi:hypothetical protein